MDKESLLVLAISFVVVMLWFPLWDHFFPPPVTPEPPPSTALRAAPSNTVSAPQTPAPAELKPAAPSPPTHSTPESLLIVTNGFTRYTFTSYGGGLRLIELLEYPASVSCDTKVLAGEEKFATLNSRAVTPSMSFWGGPRSSGSSDFALAREANGVRASKTFTNGLQVVKDFEFGTNYQMSVRLRLENRSSSFEPAGPASWAPARSWTLRTARC